MTCIYCNGETDTSGACVAQCYWSQNKRFESSKSARWNTRPIEDELRAEIDRLQAELKVTQERCDRYEENMARHGLVPVAGAPESEV